MSDKTAEKYRKLVSTIRDIADIHQAAGLLGWDQQTHMPPKGNDARSRQMAVLAGLAHEKHCDPALGEMLDELYEHPELTDEQRALVRETKRDRDRSVKLPLDLVKELTETAGRAHVVWVDSRKNDDFSAFAPLLGKLVDLKRQEARAIGFEEGGVPYDALLDTYEPGATVQKLDPVISYARDQSVMATQAIGGSSRRPKVEILKKNYPAAQQEAIGYRIIKQMGYDLQAGRLDEAAHPFTSSFDPCDVRITTRYSINWLPSSLFGTIHEAGHALYEQGLPVEHAGTPLGDSLSLGYHESQSRFWENQVGRSRAFWSYFYPELQKLFPENLGSVSLDDFHFAINTVEPSLIRVEADEVTYNLHVVVRYEIEKALFAGDVEVEDLPALWNQKMKDYLGVEPQCNADGVLQDIHWSLGSFGYFPTYLLGNLYAAQWTHAMQKELGDIKNLIENGEFAPIKKWLNENIHRHGRRYTTDELAMRVSGETLNPVYFADYLKERFQELYDVTW